uniref:Chromosomal replication initiator protein DnaA n=1 Tax=uncultured marine virus TaxID=186617 RepID=A0A0F7L7P3_9VIRU|nr:chromosomal replication initiator protein DnaA [uncultured marine virus]
MELRNIIEDVSECFEIDITKNSRNRDIVYTRAIYYWLARKTTTKSTAAIGGAVGRDHSSVLYSLKNLDNWMSFEPVYRKKFDNLKKKLINVVTVEKITTDKTEYKIKLLKIAKDILIKEVEILKKAKNKSN